MLQTLGALDALWIVILVVTFGGVLIGITIASRGGRPAGSANETTYERARREANLREMSRSAWAVLAFSILIEGGLWALSTYPRPTTSDAPVVLNMVGAGLGGVAAVVGILIGFLFGIPRTLTNEAATISPPVDGGVRGMQETSYRVNTNLEQISDWLTKILVGLGLTQLRQIPEHLQTLGVYFSGTLGGTPEMAERVVAVSVPYFVVCGFFFGYLWTRLFLSGAFRAADGPADARQRAADTTITRPENGT